MAKSYKMRIGDSLSKILKSRVEVFGTSVPKESENLAKIIKEIEFKLGMDIKNTPVLRGKPKLSTKRKLIALK